MMQLKRMRITSDDEEAKGDASASDEAVEGDDKVRLAEVAC